MNVSHFYYKAKAVRGNSMFGFLQLSGFGEYLVIFF